MPRKAADEVCSECKTVRTTPSVKARLAELVAIAHAKGDGVDRGHDGLHNMTECYLIHAILEDVLGTRKNGCLAWIEEADLKELF